MRGLTAADLLDIADRAGGFDWVSRGLLLSAYAWPDSSDEERLSLPVGVRDRLILALRVATFGRTIDLRTRCAQCAAELEAAVDAVAMLDSHTGVGPEKVTFEIDGEQCEIRQPSSHDLITTSALDPHNAAWALLERCTGRSAGVRSEKFRSAAAEALAAADPMAHIELDLQCSQCGAASTTVLDIVSFLWSEVVNGAKRVAWDVHTLAAAYGWPERDILAMTPARRLRYLNMVMA